MLINKFEFINSILIDVINTGMPEIKEEGEEIYLKFKNHDKKIENLYKINIDFYNKYLQNFFDKSFNKI
ncbi:MAG TPA: hypothetical protein DIS94_08150 [Bacteroidetes bacterium]|nr:hypothetical protein [Bacteroidota bacterium]